MLSFILVIALVVIWYGAMVFIAWAAGGAIAALIMALLIPIVLIFSVAMGRAADLGDHQLENLRKGH